jgi:alkanesulfonate monooxygenase SsuD/methylene tetrahydromethanopterin reductase-like flavin-dependent oxidoreductase (luciferase family)
MTRESAGDGDRSALVEQLRFGFYLVEPVALHDALELGVRAEQWGFDLVASCENLFWWDPGQAPVWDCFTLLTTLAERTRRLPLMTNVIDPAKRHPAVVAHILATLDNIWPGRFTLGIGPGEVANYGPLVDVSGPPPHRFYTRTREFIEVLKGLWSSTQEEPFGFEGQHFQVDGAHLSLTPVTEPHPPIYLAALGPKMKQLTGQVADGWTPVIYTPETYAADWTEVAAAAEAAGRDPRVIDRALTVSTVVLSDEQRARAFGDIVGRVMLTT